MGDPRQLNILIVMSDEHNPAITGCYGHPTVRTPALDRLARDGVVFDAAYCNSPICSPSRMAFLTGRYVHRIGVWDNSAPLAQKYPTFGSYFEAEGYDAVLCGRMHINGPDRLRGFGKRLYDDFVGHDRIGRGPDRSKEGHRGSASHVTDSGPGTALFEEGEEIVTDLTTRFLEARAREAGSSTGRPWVFVAGFIYPHFPAIAPRAYYDLYYPDKVMMPASHDEPLERQHPMIRQLRHHMCVAERVPDETIRRTLAAYYGLVTVTDERIGRMLDVIDNSALRDNTIVIYTSDHGDSGGEHGLWQKNCFYEPAVRVPLIVRGPGVARGIHVKSPVTLVDVMPTVLELGGIRVPAGLDGCSLAGLLCGAEEPERVAFSEYHCQGMENAGYMVRKGNYKYTYYVSYEPQLFDLKEDPGELHDVAQDAHYRGVRDELHRELLAIVDPEAVDAAAKANQALPPEQRANWFSWKDFTAYMEKAEA